jgi:hypothetical protein
MMCLADCHLKTNHSNRKKGLNPPLRHLNADLISMDKKEAKAILLEQIERYRNRPYQELVKLIGKDEHFLIKGRLNTEYQVEIQAFWDDKSQTNVRVIGSIDDGGVSAFFPMSVDFIRAPDGTFIGE